MPKKFSFFLYDLARTPVERLAAIARELDPTNREYEDFEKAFKPFVEKELLLETLEILQRHRYNGFPSVTDLLKDLDRLNSEIGKVRISENKRREEKSHGK